MKPKNKRLLLALLAVAGLYVAQKTRLDQGLIDEVIEGVMEALAEE